MEHVTGLPTDSISLDSINIYWSGSNEIFSVPRSNVTILSQFAVISVSSIVTIDPGQQPLPGTVYKESYSYKSAFLKLFS